MGHYEVRLAARLIQLAARLIRQFIVLIDLDRMPRLYRLV